MSRGKALKSGFMRISKEVQKGLSKAKNAPAREYAPNPKGKGVGKAATKGLPEKGSMGATAPKELPEGAKRAQELKAAKDARLAKKRANSPRRAAVDAGLATKQEAKANAQQVRGARTASRRGAGTLKNIPAEKKGLTTAQKTVGALGVFTAIGAAIGSKDRANASAPAYKSSGGPSTRGGARGKYALVKAPTSKSATPSAKTSSPSVSKPSAVTKPASPAMYKPSSERIPRKAPEVNDLKTSLPTLSGTAPKKTLQFGGLLGRQGGKWHLGRKAGKG